MAGVVSELLQVHLTKSGAIRTAPVVHVEWSTTASDVFGLADPINIGSYLTCAQKAQITRAGNRTSRVCCRRCRHRGIEERRPIRSKRIFQTSLRDLLGEAERSWRTRGYSTRVHADDVVPLSERGVGVDRRHPPSETESATAGAAGIGHHGTFGDTS